MNMTEWKNNLIASPVKKGIPVLSFPCIQLLDITVRDLVFDSQLQAKGMKAVADRCDTAASVSMMDLSVEAEAFGSKVHLTDDEVPTVMNTIVNEPEDADALKIPEIGTGRTGTYIKAIGDVVKLITDRPVLAGVIGPYSLAGRLMGMSEIMMNWFDEPEMVETVLEKCTTFIISYIKAFKEVGANGVVMAEPAAGLLSPSMMWDVSGKYCKQIVDAVQDDSFAVVYHNCGNSANKMTKEMADVGAMGYHFGDAVDMTEMCDKMPENVLVMGNVSPAKTFRVGTPEKVRSETLEVMSKCCSHSNFVISSGCDIPPASSWDNINAFFGAVNEFYAK